MIPESVPAPSHRTRCRPRWVGVAALPLLAGCATESGAPLPESQSFDVTRISDLKLDAAVRSIAAGQGVVFVGLGNGEVVAIDVSEPLAPEAIGKVEHVDANLLAFSEDRLFALAPNSLTTIDAVDPRAPKILEHRDVNGGSSLAASAARAIVTAGNRVLVGAEAQRPQVLPFTDTGATGDTVGIAVAWRAERIGVVTTTPGDIFSRGAVPQLRIFESRRGKALLAAEQLGSIELGSAGELAGCKSADLVLAHDRSDRAYLCASGHVLGVDLGDATAPKPFLDLAVPGARTIGFGREFLAVGGDGLTVIDVAQDAAPTISRRAGSGSAILDLAVVGDLVFVAAGEDGLRIYRVSRPSPPSADDAK